MSRRWSIFCHHDTHWTAVLPGKAKRQYLITFQVSSDSLLTLPFHHGSLIYPIRPLISHQRLGVTGSATKLHHVMQPPPHKLSL